MKERPILFSGPMVRAILEGRKTMTRRVIKPQPSGNFAQRGRFSNGEPGFVFERNRKNWIASDKPDMDLIRCPYGQPGDRLWVRETFGISAHNGVVPFYRSTEPDSFVNKWRPPIHMPRWACRLILEIAAVRVERVQDISDSDAEAEGIAFMREIPDADETLSPRELFEVLWDSINTTRGYGWEANPWVWVVEFKKV